MLELLKVPNEKDEMKTAERQFKHLCVTLENRLMSSRKPSLLIWNIH